uniref:Uncharacterized protein n=1 Tax=Solanum lycopersicum TaxID=4081 RepID=A0A3Q7GAE0_SOLLC
MDQRITRKFSILASVSVPKSVKDRTFEGQGLWGFGFFGFLIKEYAQIPYKKNVLEDNNEVDVDIGSCELELFIGKNFYPAKWWESSTAC